MFSREKAAGYLADGSSFLVAVQTETLSPSGINRPSVSGYQTRKSFGLDVLFMVRVSMASVRDVLHSTFLYRLLLSLSFIESCL